jgi:hypothetical protein
VPSSRLLCNLHGQLQVPSHGDIHSRNSEKIACYNFETLTFMQYISLCFNIPAGLFFSFIRGGRIGYETSFFVAGVPTNDAFHLYHCIIFIQKCGFSSKCIIFHSNLAFFCQINPLTPKNPSVFLTNFCNF